ncbi:spore coat protein [Peribacillus simplex]|uniref:spore coat protein n=1 Tax=Peribacillus simplex TaxID=1478 RepID=UPI00333669D2
MRAVLREQLRSAVETHGLISDYMVSKGYYHPLDISEQSKVNLKAANTVLNLSQR